MEYIAQTLPYSPPSFLLACRPSFNGALAEAGAHGAVAPRAMCVLNTALSLLGAVVAAFAASAAVGGKLDMVRRDG